MNPYDLFGEIPVTFDELLAWMLAVPGIAPSSPRFAYYVRCWNVVDKIRAAKASGTLEEILLDGTSAALPARLAAAGAHSRHAGRAYHHPRHERPRCPRRGAAGS